jgi:hypothetical protein
MRWAGHVARVELERKFYKVLVGKPEKEKRLLGIPRHSFEDGIRIDLGQTGSGKGVEWNKLA